MPDEVSIEVEGADIVARALAAAPGIAGPIVKRGLDQVLKSIEGQVAPYPPQPPRGRSQSFNTYVRGVGQMTRASFDESGNYTGPQEGPRGGQPRYTSEDLGQRWTSETRVVPGGYMGILGNTASYADVVQGSKQPAFHAETGWVTLLQATQKATGQIKMIFTNIMMQIAAVIERRAT